MFGSRFASAVSIGGYALFLLVALQVFVAVPGAFGRAFTGDDTAVWVTVGLATGLPLIGAVLLFRHVIAQGTTAAIDALEKVPSAIWYPAILAIGIGIRFGWALAYQPAPVSDGAAYVHLANDLLAGRQMEIAGTYAYWPPGYPFFLYVWFSLFGNSYWAQVASNVFLYVGAFVVLALLASRWRGSAAARITALIVSIWPAYFSAVGLPDKELLLVLLLPLSLLLYDRTSGLGGNTANVVLPLLSGLVLGFAALTQPSLQLFFLVLVVFEILRRSSLLWAASRLLLVLLGMALAIAPWSVRNYEVFGAPVLLTSNGGYNFYRANNPLASGGWTERGEVDLSEYGELEVSAKGYELGVQWIKENPADFAALSFRKQLRLLGDDSGGFYETLRRGLGMDGLQYLVYKGLSNLFWLALWALLLIGLFRRRREIFSSTSTIVLMYSFLYFWGIHSVFESAGKYHEPATGLLALLVALVWATPEVRRADVNEERSETPRTAAELAS